MTDLRNQRRMASQIFAIGETRVWIDPLHTEDVAAAVTREDVRGLIRKGYVQKLQATGVSRGRARALAVSKSKGKRKGPGSREGSSGSFARDPAKRRWMRTVRPLRQTLALLREEGLLQASQYRHYYLRAKGGVFRSRQHLLSHMVTEGVLTEARAKEIRAKAEAARAAQFGHRPPGEAPAPAARKAKPAKAAKPPKAERASKARQRSPRAGRPEAEGEAKPEAKPEAQPEAPPEGGAPGGRPDEPGGEP